MKCYYHTDADGLVAAFHVLKMWKCTHPNYEFNKYDFIRVDYSTNINVHEISQNENIFIVDFSFTPDVMREVLKITQNVTWIDHHISAIQRYENFEYDIPGVRYSGVAGCMLTWLYFNQMTDMGKYEGSPKELDLSMIEKAPLVTKLVANRDVWQFEKGDDTDLFTTSFCAMDIVNPNDPQLWELDSDDAYTRNAIEEAVPMCRYKAVTHARYANSRGFETVFEGYKTYALNIALVGSDVFDNLVNRDDYELFMIFLFNGTEFNYTLYPNREGISAAEIAMKYGGGGHVGAAGFRSPDLLVRKK